MNIHVLLDSTFFATSVPIGDQQRLLPIPTGKGLHVGDVVFLRDEHGQLTWVGDVLAAGEIESTDSWTDAENAKTRRHAIVGYLARIHPDALPKGTSKLAARWVTLNRRTLPGTLPWWDDHILVYHSTLRLIEGILTAEQAQLAEKRGHLNRHPSGHWCIPHGEARKRIMVDILDVELVCGLCGGLIDGLEAATQDHIIPVSQGGPDTLANVQLAHRACNELKGNALPEQYPPFFPQPGNTAAGWYGRTSRSPRNGRGGRQTRGRKGQTTTRAAAFQVERRDISAIQSAADGDVEPTAAAHPRTDTEKAAQNGEKQQRRKDMTTHNESSRKGLGDGEASETATAEDKSTQASLSAEERAWLAQVQAAGLKKVQAYAKEPQWAARTASLRTLEQLPRTRAGKARTQGTLLAEASGPKGRFRLLRWQDEHILVEERGRRQSVHLVQMSAAISPEAYVSYLTRFGRTSPLAVIMALLPFWREGDTDGEGRIEITKNDEQLVVVVDDDQIVRCEKPSALAAS